MPPGDFTSFVIALLMLYEPVKRLTGIHNIFEQAIGASSKVFEVLDRSEEIHDKPGAAGVERFKDSGVFEDGSVRYPGSPMGFSLRSIALVVTAGESVALGGPS